MSNRVRKAIEAYRSIMMAPREEGESGWFPPPSDFLRDKKWSKELRWMWPGYASVRIDNTDQYTEMKAWCEEFAHFYWRAGSGHVWYFSEKKSAVAFKLIFGGVVGEE